MSLETILQGIQMLIKSLTVRPRIASCPILKYTNQRHRVQLLAQHLQPNTGLQYEPKLPDRNYLQYNLFPTMQIRPLLSLVNVAHVLSILSCIQDVALKLGERIFFCLFLLLI